MDPITLTSIVASSLSIADIATRLGFGLRQLQNDFTGALDHVDNIILHTETVELAIREICRRLHGSPDTFPQPFKSLLAKSTTAIGEIIKQIEAHARAVKNAAEDSQTKARFLHLHCVHKVKQWETSLTAQIQALSLLLQVAQLRSSDERTSVLEQESSKRLFERASSMSAKHCDSPHNPSSSRSYPADFQIFTFDSTLLETKVYQRACLSSLRREISQNAVASSSNTSASNDAVASQNGPSDPESSNPSNTYCHKPLSSSVKRYGLSPRKDLTLDDSVQERLSICAAPASSRNSLPTAIVTSASSSIHEDNVAVVHNTIPPTTRLRGSHKFQQSNFADTSDDIDASLRESEKDFQSKTQQNTALKLPMNLGSSTQPSQETSETLMTFTTTSFSSTGLDTSVTENSSSTQRTSTTAATTVSSTSDKKASHDTQSEINSGLGKSVIIVNVEQVGSDHIDLVVHEASCHYDIVRDAITKIRDSILKTSGIDPLTYRGHMISCTIETCGEAVHKFPFTAAFLAAALEKMEEGLYSSIDIHAQFSTPNLQKPEDNVAQTLTSWRESEEVKVKHASANITAKPITTMRDGVPHIVFGKNYQLPMSRQNMEAKGGYSHIFRMQIHLDHHKFPRGRDAERSMTVAIKRLRSTDYDAFRKEAQILRAFSGQSTKFSIIRLLATFEHKGFYHLVFPWASGNLLEYWRDNDSKISEYHLYNRISNIHWMLQECTGIARALSHIHGVLNKPARSICRTLSSKSQRLYGRHGDLKPSNILWFSGSLGFDRLLIADMGLARVHLSSQTTQISLIPRTPCTPTYRAPEYDLVSTGVDMTSAYDIWSLGCIFLEFLTWSMAGDAQRRAFARNRATYDKDAAFFITRDGKSMVNPAVSQEIKKLTAMSESFAPILREAVGLFLETTKSCLELEDGNRPTADLLRKKLQSSWNSVKLIIASLQGAQIFIHEPTLAPNTDILQMVIERSMENYAESHGGYWIPLASKNFGGRVGIARLLLNNGTNLTPSQAASFIDHFEIFQLLLDAGANINPKSQRYERALQTVLRGRYTQILMWLLFNDAGTDTDPTPKHCRLEAGKEGYCYTHY